MAQSQSQSQTSTMMNVSSRRRPNANDDGINSSADKPNKNFRQIQTWTWTQCVCVCEYECVCTTRQPINSPGSTSSSRLCVVSTLCNSPLRALRSARPPSGRAHANESDLHQVAIRFTHSHWPATMCEGSGQGSERLKEVHMQRNWPRRTMGARWAPSMGLC